MGCAPHETPCSNIHPKAASPNNCQITSFCAVVTASERLWLRTSGHCLATVLCRKRKRDGRERVHAPATDPQSASGLIHSASKGAEDKSFHTFRRTLAVNPATDADAYHLWGRSECSQVLNLAPDMQQLARNLKQVSSALMPRRGIIPGLANCGASSP